MKNGGALDDNRNLDSTSGSANDDQQVLMIKDLNKDLRKSKSGSGEKKPKKSAGDDKEEMVQGYVSPYIGFSYQHLQNDTLRKDLKLTESGISKEGILVVDIQRFSPLKKCVLECSIDVSVAKAASAARAKSYASSASADGGSPDDDEEVDHDSTVVEKGDVLLAIADHPDSLVEAGVVPIGMSREERMKVKNSRLYTMASNGPVQFRGGDRTVFEYALQRQPAGETLDLASFRPSSHPKHSLRIFLYASKHDILCAPSTLFNRKPEFVFMGGLVFQPVTWNLYDTVSRYFGGS